MTVKELREKLTTLTDDDRCEHLRRLWGKLNPVSLRTLTDFQTNWDYASNPPPEGADKFSKEQNRIILDCVRIEQSDLGIIVRDTLVYPHLKTRRHCEQIRTSGSDEEAKHPGQPTRGYVRLVLLAREF